jgi:hypothetical protein
MNAKEYYDTCDTSKGLITLLDEAPSAEAFRLFWNQLSDETKWFPETTAARHRAEARFGEKFVAA